MGRRWLRTSLALIVTAMLMTGCAAAVASSGVAVLNLSPSSIQAGFQISVSASCGENLNPAFVSSRAFGSITLTADHSLLQQTVTIPQSTTAGVYTVSLRCASGQRSSAKLTVLDGHGKPVDHGKPVSDRGPDTGGGEMAASGGARVALGGGLLAIVAGIGLWVVSAFRRRAAARG